MAKITVTKEELKNPDTMVSLFLGVAVVVVAGVLIVNYVRNNKSAGNVPENKETTNQVTGAPTNLPTTHTVAEGETLWSISETYFKSGYNYVDIVSANNLSNANSIEVGQKLTIPSVAPKMPEAPTVSPTAEVKKPEDGKYTIQSGDSLWKISLSVYGTGYRWPEIAKLNKLANPNLIYTGNVLMLP